MRLRGVVLCRFVLSASVAATLLAGCGGSQPPIGAPGAMPQSRAIGAQAPRRQALIYVIYPVGGDVAIYTMSGKLYTPEFIGPLNQPQAACADKVGHVFITVAGSSQIIEYNHGGTTPVATLNDPGEYPASCSADPKSGRLAVTNYLAAGGGRGSVSVYENARGSPKIYADDRILQYGFCAYDSNSDLFIDGFKTLKKGFEFAELPYGSKVFKSINLGLHMKGWAGPLRWDGQDIAFADPRAHAIDRLDNGRIVGSVPLKDYTGSDFFIEKGQIGTVLPVTRGPVSFWKYPEGGSRTRSFLLNPQPMDIPFYVTVSK